jgi:hypothetical protein
MGIDVPGHWRSPGDHDGLTDGPGSQRGGTELWPTGSE